MLFCCLLKELNIIPEVNNKQAAICRTIEVRSDEQIDKKGKQEEIGMNGAGEWPNGRTK